jgi:polyphosphate glucokinase
MKVLVVDVGGSHVKVMVSGCDEERRMESGPALTAAQMAAGVRALARGWKYEAVAIGYPGPVVRNRPAAEPRNLGAGWVDFDYEKAFGCPVRMVNDAAMQALGGYNGGKMLFLGFGTGLGTTLIVDGVLVPMELAHLPYRRATFEDYVGARALERFGRRRWRKYVVDVVARLTAALEPEDIVLGGGNAAHLEDLPPRCRTGANSNAFPGGFRLWASAGSRARAGGARPTSAGRKAVGATPGKPKPANAKVKAVRAVPAMPKAKRSPPRARREKRT